MFSLFNQISPSGARGLAVEEGEMRRVNPVKRRFQKAVKTLDSSSHLAPSIYFQYLAERG